MPIQAPQWTDYLNCPVCCREFGPPSRSPISLGCGHTLCRHCLKNLHRKQCPFDQTVIQSEPEELVVNTALLQLAGYAPPAQPFHPPCIKALPEHDRQAYDAIVRCLEHLAIYLKLCGSASNSLVGSRLSRPMQRKLVTLIQCAMTDEEGRGRAARAARSLGERTVTELLLQHQNPQHLSANLWAAVRARGCQFLGPAMQEEVLKLVLLALEDGSALSRKVLVMFVVQRLEPHFPQASKTSIGHVVQLLYRASCFKVSKRESDSSLMQLKEEFRTYESLRREHDAQIVQIATEGGLRIAPDQWSALLYGDTSHKSHMQSIIDKLQTPQSFAQSVQELFIALQRTGDPAQLVVMSMHLDRLASIDASPDAKSPSWQQLAEVITSIKEVVSGLVHYLQQQGRDTNHNQKNIIQDRCLEPSTSQSQPLTAVNTPTHSKKMPTCRESVTRALCPRGSACTLMHLDEVFERMPNNGGSSQMINGNYTYAPPPLAGVQLLAVQMPLTPHVYRYPLAPLLQQGQVQLENHNMEHIPPLASPVVPQEMIPNSVFAENHRADANASSSYSQITSNQMPTINQNGMMMPMGDQHLYSGMLPPNVGNPRPEYPCAEFPRPEFPRPEIPRPEFPRPEYPRAEFPRPEYQRAEFPRPEYPRPVYPRPEYPRPVYPRPQYPRPEYPRAEFPCPWFPVQIYQPSMQPVANMFIPIQHREPPKTSPYALEEIVPGPSELLPDHQVKPFTNGRAASESSIDSSWSPNSTIFNFGEMNNVIQTIIDDDKELEEEMQALERRMDTELSFTD